MTDGAATNQGCNMSKQVTRYQIREFVGSDYSRQLGRRLRTREQAVRIVKMLRKAGRDVFSAPMKIAA